MWDYVFILLCRRHCAFWSVQSRELIAHVNASDGFQDLVKMHCDNQAHNPTFHKPTKHGEVNYHFILRQDFERRDL